MLYVYITPHFQKRKNAFNELNLAGFIDSLKEQLDSGVPIRQLFEPFPPYWKRRRGKEGRIFARLISVGEDEVFCFIELLRRKSHDYLRLLTDIRDYMEPLLPSQQELEKWVEEQKASGVEIISKPPLPETAVNWLYPPQWMMGASTDASFTETKGNSIEEILIYESREWVSRFRQQSISDFWQTYYEILSDIAQDADLKAQYIMHQVWMVEKRQRAVLYIRELDQGSPILFLVAPLTLPISPQEIKYIVETTLHITPAQTEGPKPASEKGSDNSSHNEHYLLRLAARSYPGYILADEATWLAIERDSQANLALSPQEEELLRDISMATPGASRLPVFINGRAGSGKSTMLYYLFADYCYRKQQGDLQEIPLFLTYSERLLDVAYQNVQTLLLAHHRFLSEQSHSQHLPQNIKPYFFHFRDFLLNLLPPGEASKFQTDKLITFDTFKRLYQGINLPPSLKKHALRLPERNKYSSEFCWHVIRTFIKGYDIHECLTSEDFGEISRRERTILADDYEKVCQTVWEKWYQGLAEEGFWDEQDLVRKVLELECFDPKFAAIFCDEAQDFTHIELYLLLRLSIFPDYEMGHYLQLGLPFAFAGDPFQTLNPTGFRWSNVQAIFYTEIIQMLDPGNKWNLSINYKELEYNYRSIPPVVRFGNLIQLWRHTLLHGNDIKPQQVWQIDESIQPEKYILAENIQGDELALEAENTIIIIPAEEGQEREYARKDPFLSALVSDSESDPPKNILSPMAAKGLEFDRVVLYKFGDAFTYTMERLLNPKEQELKTELAVQLEYFFNKLYVAATRAKRFLFIVDTETGDKNLWRYASYQNLINNVVQLTETPELWEGSVGLLQKGTDIKIRENAPDLIAEEFEEKGWIARNASLLRRAKQFYIAVGMTTKAEICEAKALRVEGNLRQAARLFLKNNKNDDARDCYWDGHLWLELIDWYRQIPLESKQNDAFFAIASFLRSAPEDIETVKQFLGFLTHALESTQVGKPFNPQWLLAVTTLAQRIHRLHQRFSLEHWHQIAFVLQAMIDQGFRFAPEILGLAYYYSGNLSAALSVWTTYNITPPEYFLVKAQIDGYPVGLVWLEQGGFFQKIVEIWEQHGGLTEAHGREWIKYVCPALEKTGRIWDALVLYQGVGNYRRVKELFDQHQARFTVDQLGKSLSFVIDSLLRESRWVEAIDELERLERRIRDAFPLQAKIIRSIAYSNRSLDLGSADKRIQLEKFASRITNNSVWQDQLTMQEVGAGLERIGGLVETLMFYEEFVDDPDFESRQHARSRWIATKQRQIKYQKQQMQSEPRIRSNERQLAQNAGRWGFGYNEDLPPFPILPRPWHHIIQGVPTGTNVEVVEDGHFRFIVDHYEVRVQTNSKVLSILHLETFQQTLINIDHRQIMLPPSGHNFQIEEEDRIIFTVQEGEYKGEVRYTSSLVQVVLNVNEIEISVDFQ